MSLDPEVLPLLEMFEAMGMPDPDTVTPQEMREAMPAFPVENPTPVRTVENREIPGPGGALSVRVFTPDVDEPAGVVMYFHGGGWVIGDLDTTDEMNRMLCARSDAVVVSVDYRLAPEAPFPQGLEDCYAATTWVADNLATSQPLAVAGDSAGANLATAVCLLARERGGPDIAHQLLVYPVTDTNFDRPSYVENAEGYLLTRDMMRWFWMHYLPAGVEPGDPLAAPLHANLDGLPSATIVTAGYDPLRDEGMAYAEALSSAGVEVEHRDFEGMVHGFVTFPAGLTQTGVALDYLCDRLRGSFAGD